MAETQMNEETHVTNQPSQIFVFPHDRYMELSNGFITEDVALDVRDHLSRGDCWFVKFNDFIAADDKAVSILSEALSSRVYGILIGGDDPRSIFQLNGLCTSDCSIQRLELDYHFEDNHIGQVCAFLTRLEKLDHLTVHRCCSAFSFARVIAAASTGIRSLEIQCPEVTSDIILRLGSLEFYTIDGRDDTAPLPLVSSGIVRLLEQADCKLTHLQIYRHRFLASDMVALVSALRVNSSLQSFQFDNIFSTPDKVCKMLERFDKLIAHSERIRFTRYNAFHLTFPGEREVEVYSADPHHLSLFGISQDLLDLLQWDEVEKLEMDADNFEALICLKALPSLKKLILLESSPSNSTLPLILKSIISLANQSSRDARLVSNESIRFGDIQDFECNRSQCMPIITCAENVNLGPLLGIFINRGIPLMSATLDFGGSVQLRSNCTSHATIFPDASTIELCGQIISSLCIDDLEQLRGLDKLDLRPTIGQPTPPGLERFTQLKSLSFEALPYRRRPIGFDSTKIIGLLSRRDCALMSLSLVGCKMESESFRVLFQALGKNSSLRHLELRSMGSNEVETSAMLDYFSHPNSRLEKFKVQRWIMPEAVQKKFKKVLEVNTQLEEFKALSRGFCNAIHPLLLRNFSTKRTLRHLNLPPRVFPQILSRIQMLRRDQTEFGGCVDAIYQVLRESPVAHITFKKII